MGKGTVKTPTPAVPISSDTLRLTLLATRLQNLKNDTVAKQAAFDGQLQTLTGKVDVVLEKFDRLTGLLAREKSLTTELATVNLQWQLRNAELVIKLERANAMCLHNAQLAAHYKHRLIAEFGAPLTPPISAGVVLERPTWVPNQYQTASSDPLSARAPGDHGG
jgi:hypothetical protein